MSAQGDNSTPDEQSPALDDEQRARRRLLKMTAYVAPAVIGTLLIGRTALAQTASCAPTRCLPNIGPCQPQSCKPRP